MILSIVNGNKKKKTNILYLFFITSFIPLCTPGGSPLFFNQNFVFFRVYIEGS